LNCSRKKRKGGLTRRKQDKKGERTAKFAKSRRGIQKVTWPFHVDLSNDSASETIGKTKELQIELFKPMFRCPKTQIKLRKTI